MSLHCGTRQLAILVLVLVLNIGCAAAITAIVAAVIISGRRILIEKGMWRIGIGFRSSSESYQLDVT